MTSVSSVVATAPYTRSAGLSVGMGILTLVFQSNLSLNLENVLQKLAEPALQVALYDS